MENLRLELHEKFCEILGSRNAYYNPPESLKLKYPAIVYNPKPIDNSFANNGVYMQSQGYKVIVIDEDPEGVIAKKVSQLPTCRPISHFTSDNLVHDVFELYH